ncbi:hypothetical protein [Methylobacterium sp. Gmos1]
MPAFLANFIKEIATKSLYTFIALFVIGGAQRLADYMQVKPAQDILHTVDGVLIQERTNVVAQGPVVVVSDPSNSAVVNGEPAAQ